MAGQITDATITKFHRSGTIDSAKIYDLCGDKVLAEGRIRIVVSNVDASHVLTIRAKLLTQTAWTNIDTMTGNGSEVFDFTTWDQIQIETTTYGGTPGVFYISGFFYDLNEGVFTPVGLSEGGLITEYALDDTTWTLVPALTGSNNISVQNQSDNEGIVLWNYTNSAPATEGWRIEDGGHKSVAIKANTIGVYCRMLSGTGTIAVDEVK